MANNLHEKSKKSLPNSLSLAIGLTENCEQWHKYEPPLPSIFRAMAAYTMHREPSSVVCKKKEEDKKQTKQKIKKYI